MKLNDYFTAEKGTGVMAPSNKQGVVDTATYAKPHV